MEENLHTGVPKPIVIDPLYLSGIGVTIVVIEFRSDISEPHFDIIDNNGNLYTSIGIYKPEYIRGNRLTDIQKKELIEWLSGDSNIGRIPPPNRYYNITFSWYINNDIDDNYDNIDIDGHKLTNIPPDYNLL